MFSGSVSSPVSLLLPGAKLLYQVRALLSDVILVGSVILLVESFSSDGVLARSGVLFLVCSSFSESSDNSRSFKSGSREIGLYLGVDSGVPFYDLIGQGLVRFTLQVAIFNVVVIFGGSFSCDGKGEDGSNGSNSKGTGEMSLSLSDSIMY